MISEKPPCYAKIEVLGKIHRPTTALVKEMGVYF